ncbi:aldehyde dehydrogenase (NAD+) [Chitinophaga sancti]|uniref:Aldehyde dehydrogenase (NAD+) n=2 Tax=Chitinophaga sancti TaxID=1004 RepID=A0A1K1ND69_9BACT|nr:aldehyde dehydrogenase (NAD+) [Chitinophaga sancti]
MPATLMYLILRLMEPVNKYSLHCYAAGNIIQGQDQLTIRSPYDQRVIGTLSTVKRADTLATIEAAFVQKPLMSHFERYQVLNKAQTLLGERKAEFGALISAESGLCIREAMYETGRAMDVLLFAAIAALQEPGQVFSCDVSPHGRARKIYTVQEPVALAVAITPFNHPLNQVAHKVAPALAAGTPVILKPSEKTPLTAIRFVELLYEAGLPPHMLSVLLGPTNEVAEVLVSDPRVSVVSFTGSVAVGKRIAQTAGYKKVILELGGNDPLIILEDADMELAVTLAAEGAFRNSGQRCTAVKRILVQESIHDEFVTNFIEKTKTYTCGDPAHPDTIVGTVIDEAAAIHLELLIEKAVAQGAQLLQGGTRQGALLQPAVLTQVPRHAEMVVQEAFGPLAPVMAVKDIEDAVTLANSTAYGLSSGIVTSNLQHAMYAIKHIKAGTVNINEVPGYRIEHSPFGGIKDSGLGIKEGVTEAMKTFSFTKTYSLPW